VCHSIRSMFGVLGVYNFALSHEMEISLNNHATHQTKYRFYK
jgi:hypothetical protein